MVPKIKSRKKSNHTNLNASFVRVKETMRYWVRAERRHMISMLARLDSPIYVPIKDLFAGVVNMRSLYPGQRETGIVGHGSDWALVYFCI
jgi:hypothetical protein